MNLLLITENENKHYVLIKDFNTFMFYPTKHHGMKHFSIYCLQHFNSEDILSKHMSNCFVINGEQSIKTPKKRSLIKFENHYRQLQVPFVIYADFEALLEKIQKCQRNGDKSFTEAC